MKRGEAVRSRVSLNWGLIDFDFTIDRYQGQEAFRFFWLETGE